VSEPSQAVLLDIFTKMSLLKQNDERMRAVIKSGRLVMPYYSYRGQEVIPSAISVLLNDTDFICTIYRGTHDSLAKGCRTRDRHVHGQGRPDAHHPSPKRRHGDHRHRRLDDADRLRPCVGIKA
jgi:TPP-dependent pyruvate/acetoin dehydrogenase alpha subunit